jgi:hypothetical protein
MRLFEVYSDPPRYPPFVANTLSFKGTSRVYEGVIDATYDLDSDDIEIVEGINVFRKSYFLTTRETASSPFVNHGNYYVYSTAPYPFVPEYPNSGGFRDYLHPSFNYVANINDWDVYNHYRLAGYNLSSLDSDDSTNTTGRYLPSISQVFEGDYLAKVSRNYLRHNYLGVLGDFYDSLGSSSGINGVTYHAHTIPTVVKYSKKPYYIDLASGYLADERKILNNPTIIPQQSSVIDIAYYRENKLEQVSDVRSIDWMTYQCSLIENVPYELPIVDCVLGTLQVNDSLKTIIKDTLVDSSKYPLKYFFVDELPDLFLTWNAIYNNPTNVSLETRTLRVIGANNNHWNNRPIPTADLNFDITHPMFAIDNQRAYDWHIAPQSDGSYGNLLMDSPRTIEIHTALNAGQYLLETPAIVGTGTIDNPQTPAAHRLDWYIKNSAGSKITAIWKALGGDKYGVNELDNTKDRVTNLGFLVERIAKVLGIRFDDNGKIEVDKEKATVRKLIDKSKDVDPEKVGINGFGDGGMVVKRINNRFKNKGEIVSDQCVILQDIPDLIQEYFEQSNLALGIQESSAIEIKQDGTAARFNSQLEILVELVNLMSSGNEMTRAALVSSLVTQSQTNELIAGLGLPSVTKTIPIKIGKKVSQVPFKGIAAHRSISQEVATCTYNIGVVLGQVL